MPSAAHAPPAAALLAAALVLAAAGAALALWRGQYDPMHVLQAGSGTGPQPGEHAMRPPHVGLVVHGGGVAFTREHFLVQTLNTYGRYSNMRVSFVDHATLAHYTNRTLLFAPFQNCEAGETLDDLLDTSGWAGLVRLREMPLPAQLNLTCAPDASTMFVHADWEGFRRYDSPTWLVGALPAGSKPGDVWQHSNVSWVLRGMCRIYDEAIPVTSTCVSVHNIWKLENRYYDRTHAVLQRRLRPAHAVEAEVRRFLLAHRLLAQRPNSSIGSEPPVPFVGAHLRLTDLGGSSGRTGPCRVNLTEFSRQVRTAMRQLDTATVLLATDDLEAACATTFIAEFKPVIVASGVWRSSSCREAVFSQEVLALSAGFVGSNVNSTFSETIEAIRCHRVRLPGALPGVALPPFDDKATYRPPTNTSTMHPGFLEACA